MTIKTTDWRTKSRPSTAVANNPADDLGFEIHHTVTARADTAKKLAQITRSIYDDHVGKRGWADVFYGFLVGDTGAITEARGFDHGTSKDHRWCTIALVGNYNSGTVTDAQRASVTAIIAEGVKRGVAPAVRGHGDRAATECPGTNGRAFVAQLAEGLDLRDVDEPEPQAGRPSTFTAQVDWPYLRRGSRGPAVSLYQSAANLTQGVGLVVDGIFGKRSEAATITIQWRHRLVVDGIVGPQTAGQVLTVR